MFMRNSLLTLEYTCWLDLRAISWLAKSQKLRTLLISQLQISECPLSNHNDHLSAPILILGKRNSWGRLKSGEYGGWLNWAAPFLPKNCWTIATVCGRALSRRRNNFRSLHNSSLTWAICLYKQSKTWTQNVAFTVYSWWITPSLSKNKISVCLYPWFLKLKFFGGRRVLTAPFGTLALYFWILRKRPALVTSN